MTGWSWWPFFKACSETLPVIVIGCRSESFDWANDHTFELTIEDLKIKRTIVYCVYPSLEQRSPRPMCFNIPRDLAFCTLLSSLWIESRRIRSDIFAGVDITTFSWRLTLSKFATFDINNLSRKHLQSHLEWCPAWTLWIQFAHCVSISFSALSNNLVLS